MAQDVLRLGEDPDHRIGRAHARTVFEFRLGGDEDTDFGRVLIGKRKQVAGVEGFLDARGEAGADAVVAFVFHGHRRIAFGDARGLVGDGGVGFGRSVSGEGGDGGQQQGEAQSQRAEIGVHTSAS